MASVPNIIEKLAIYKLPVYKEKTLQAAVEEVFVKHDIPFEREYRLDDKNIVDFYCQGIAVEVKIKGSARSIYKQCERYCEFEEVESLLLLTNKTIGFPSEINGKPCFVHSLSTSWL